jgi:D-serine deaminase-like pyridoxal phosphate-dependent protein
VAAVERNIARMQSYCDEHRLQLRPHVKTHKSIDVTRMQLRAGAAGITCQKMSEAEVMATVADDILVAFPLLGIEKTRRFARQARMSRLVAAGDSEAVMRGLDTALAAENSTAGFMVECDTGQGRAGVQTPAEAVELAELCMKLPRLRFVGLMTHPLPSDGAWLAEACSELGRRGVPVDRVSVGGTPTAFSVHTAGVATELRAGTYVYGDRACLANGVMTLGDCAFRVRATVVSRPTPTRAILDAGSKALSSDPGIVPNGGFGLLVEHPDAKIHELHEEHGVVDVSGCDVRPALGERVSIVPNHVCVTVNLYDEMVVHRDGDVVGSWPVSARGMLR